MASNACAPLTSVGLLSSLCTSALGMLFSVTLSDVAFRLPEPVLPVNIRAGSTWEGTSLQAMTTGAGEHTSGPLAPDGESSEANPPCLQSNPV